MSEADKRFEKLGFKKTTYGKSRIVYSKELDLEGFCIHSIWFDKVRRDIRLNGYYSMQELQAINEKVKELGWIE